MTEINKKIIFDAEDMANKIRCSTVRMTSLGSSSHIGSILSIADIIAVLYAEILNVDPVNTKDPNRDRFILSKGHAGACVYAALAERGFIEKSVLDTHYQDGSILSGHVSHKGIPGVEFSTGALGHGLPVASGMAYSGKISQQQHRIFCLMSDGECDEGSNWEAILFSGHHKLSNLIAIIDFNGLQSMKSTTDTLNLEPFKDKWLSFGWDVIEVDGHDYSQLRRALSYRASAKKPLCIVANTTKGKGVSFMENSVLWHYRSPKGDEYNKAIKELGCDDA
jgi:transketolase